VRLSLRFLVPLLIALAAFAYAAVPLVDRLMTRWFERDLESRSSLIASSLEEPLDRLLAEGGPSRIIAYFDRLTQDERLYAVGLCLPAMRAPIASERFPADVDCRAVADANEAKTAPVAADHGTLRLAVRPITTANGASGRVIIAHDMTFIERRSEETRRYLFYFFVALGAIVALITVVIAQLSWRGWMQGMRALLRGEGLWRPAAAFTAPELRPIERDVRELVRELARQQRPRNADGLMWTKDTLRETLRRELRGSDVIVVSNREPYIHVQTDAGIRVQRPASGLVTALEPVMRACSGTWIAHGSGSADRATVDSHDRVGVPPDRAAYQLRRVWLTAEEEAGYYSGFANEGLWPLCHIAHVRPTFRSEDFAQYRRVNAKFAKAVAAESRTPDPIVLVQDYHFALLPEMIRRRLPKATVITFWHIPWPNPEAFAICPWREELLKGLLGSSILGFHTRFHCNNFLDTVDRLLEARVDREALTVARGGHTTAVRRYPISIDWPPEALERIPAVPEARALVRKRFDLPASHRLGVGVDRLDYTKGILERFQAIGRLLETERRWIGRFTFVQVAAPTRGMISEYRDYATRARELADAINARYPRAAFPPIILLTEHHEPDAVYTYHRAADLCFVSSLHDGMNLVAKEFVAARDDEQGVLILSRFAGASRELPEAIVVNPYDADQCAAALHLALTMSPDEQRDRMRLMRSIVRDFNVYRWAGRMLLDAATMRERGRFHVDEAVGGRV